MAWSTWDYLCTESSDPNKCVRRASPGETNENNQNLVKTVREEAPVVGTMMIGKSWETQLLWRVWTGIQSARLGHGTFGLGLAQRPVYKREKVGLQGGYDPRA